MSLRLAALSGALVAALVVPALVSAPAQAADGSGTLKSTTPHPAVPRNGFVTNSVSCSLDDLTIDQLKTFLMEIEMGSKVVAVTHIDLRRDFRSKEKLDVNLEISTYSKEPPAKTEGEGSAEKKGS